uniref:Uncharacterized protein n=1 Tax=Sphaeramia orbicularis TaxID=375764 RepID=A0A673BBI9_9TELE
MADSNLQQEFEDQFNDVVSRLQSKQLFQSDWDIASFAIFFIFIAVNHICQSKPGTADVKASFCCKILLTKQ